MPTLHEVQEKMRKLVEQDQRNAEARRVYARNLLNEAAPAMLEALEIMVDIFQPSSRRDSTAHIENAAYQKARAAIAKAKGEIESLVTS